MTVFSPRRRWSCAGHACCFVHGSTKELDCNNAPEAKFNTSTGYCECPDMQEWDEVAGSCECPAETFLNADTGLCECLGIQEWDGDSCECPTGTTWQQTQVDPDLVGGGEYYEWGCECPEMKVWDDSSNRCECAPGTIANQVTELNDFGLPVSVRVCECRDTYEWVHVNGWETGSCECPSGYIEVTTRPRHCECDGEMLPYFIDADGDGYGASDLEIAFFCGALLPVGFVDNDYDTDDADATIFPGSLL